MKIVAAISGGVDSMALLAKLYEQGYQIIVAHVNYQKRVDSYKDELAIRKFIKDKNIELETLIVSKENYTNENFQKQARKIRYDFFIEVAKKKKCNEIYVAHHMDDVLETYLFQKNRSGLYDHYGIKTRTVFQEHVIVRPLLNYTKSDLIEYVTNKGIEYHEDSSNKTLVYTRNKIRQQLVELSMESKKALIMEIKYANRDIEKQKMNISNLVARNIFKVVEFNNLSLDEKRRLLFEKIKKYDITLVHIDEIIRMINEVNSFKKPFLDTTIYKSYDIIYFINDKCFNYFFEINNDDEYFKCQKFFDENFNYKINKQQVEYPFVIRKHEVLDIEELNIGYKNFRRKIKKQKIAFFMREYLPVIEKDGIVLGLI